MPFASPGASDGVSIERPFKNVLFGAFALILGTSLALWPLTLEVVLRFLPVATGLWTLPVNAGNPVFRFTPNRDFVYSRDWNFSLVNRGHVTTDGFVNDENYTENDPRPLLAVIGDSYVEAAMVPNDKTFYRRAAERLGQGGRIYSFGASGAPLSQYLVWAQYAAQKYHPNAIVILVVADDFDESLWDYDQRSGLHVYARGADRRLHLRRIDYQPSYLSYVVRHSALGRYLVFNLGARDVVRRIAAQLGLISPAAAATPEHAGNTAAEASIKRVRESEEAIAAFFEDVAKMTGLPPSHVAFLIDGARYQRDIPRIEQSFFGLMRAHFMREASQRGYEAIDLQPWFVMRSPSGDVRFEYPTDGHWNPLGQEVVAEALANSAVYRMTFGKK